MIDDDLVARAKAALEGGWWSPKDLEELVARVEELQAVVDSDDSTAARIHRQWRETRRRIKAVRTLCSQPFDNIEVESTDGEVQPTAVLRVEDVLAAINGGGAP